MKLERRVTWTVMTIRLAADEVRDWPEAEDMARKLVPEGSRVSGRSQSGGEFLMEFTHEVQD